MKKTIFIFIKRCVFALFLIIGGAIAIDMNLSCSTVLGRFLLLVGVFSAFGGLYLAISTLVNDLGEW